MTDWEELKREILTPEEQLEVRAMTESLLRDYLVSLEQYAMGEVSPALTKEEELRLHGGTIEELLEWQNALEVGHRYRILSNFCAQCESEQLVFLVKLEATDDTVPGTQRKVVAQHWPYVACDGCKRECRGKVETGDAGS